MSISATDIANWALSKVGGTRINNIDETTPNGRKVKLLYGLVLKAEMAGHPWSFASKEASLAALVTAPLFEREFAYQLPADYLGWLRPYPEAESLDRDWKVMGDKIYTNDEAPLEITYTAFIEDTAKFHTNFIEVVACKLAHELAEPLTQSNTKIDRLWRDYIFALQRAGAAGAQESVPDDPAEDRFVTAMR